MIGELHPTGALATASPVAATAGELPAALHAALGALADVLDELGYRQLYAQGVAPGLFADDRVRTLAALAAWPAPEREALRLLGLGAAADAAALPSALAAALPALRAAGLVTGGGATVRAEGWVVVPVLGGHLLTRLPPGYLATGTVGSRAYLGPDSLRLAGALPPARGRRVLDLGAGCGVQGLLATPGAAEAVLVDLEPDSVHLSACNRVLNRVPHPVRVLAGDLYAPVAGERFDLIVALPPYVPGVGGDRQSTVTAGGADGLGLLRRIVAGAAAHLAPGGELVALCQLLCRDRVPLLSGELSSLAPELDARLAVGDWHPLQPYLVELATSLVRHGARPTGPDTPGGSGPASGAGMDGVRDLVARYSASLRPLGVTGVCTAILRLRRPSAGGVAGSVRVVGSRPLAGGDVLGPAPGLVVSADPALQTAVARDAASVVEAPTAALLRALDGRRTIAEAAATAWGRLAGADPADVVDQAVHRVAQLQDQGLAVPVAGAAAAGTAGQG